MKPQETTAVPPTTAAWQWLTLALLAQMGWGAYPVLLRYLQTISGIPGLSLLTVGNFLVLLIVHLVSLSLFSGFVSLLIGEDWGVWQTLPPADWLLFGLFSLGILAGANLGQIRSIQHLGAPLVSSLMAIRLVSALLFAGLLLGEQLSSVWQVVGTAVVIITITWYLRQQT